MTAPAQNPAPAASDRPLPDGASDGPQQDGPAEEGTASARPTRSRRRSLILWAVVAVVVVTGAVLMAAFGPRRDPPKQLLEPTSTRWDGTQAVVQVLRGRGVQVDREDRWAQVQGGGRERTLLVSRPDVIPTAEQRELAGLAEHVVLVQPSAATLDTLGLPLITLPNSDTSAQGTAPECDLPAARNAGTTALEGEGYARVAGMGSSPGDTPVTLCYPIRGSHPEGSGMIAQWQHDGTTFTAVGSHDIFTNSRITDAPGRAALGLWLLGENDQLTWWMVDYADPAFAPETDEPTDPFSLLPPWVGMVGWWLVAVAGLAVLWRFRRLGALVPEPLPVVVRSAETTIGRAALYRQIKARERAAELIRRRTLTRLRPLLGLGPRTPVDQVVVAAAVATGWPQARLDRLLRPGPVPDDPTLLAITRETDQLLHGLSWLAPGRGDASPPHRKGQQ